MLSTTNAPESAEVMIKLQINTTPNTLRTIANGNFSKNTYKAVEISLFTASITAVSPCNISFIVTPPKAVNHKKVTAAGRINTQSINPLMVRPLEIRAMKVPTKGDQEIHHPQYMMVLIFCQLVSVKVSVQVVISIK